jgi:hypothetical protein
MHMSRNRAGKCACAVTLTCAALAAGGAAGCSTGTGNATAQSPYSSPKVVLAAPPPKDDGTASQGGAGGASHSAAMEQLKIAKLTPRVDKQNSMTIPLPDAEHWTRVKFWGVPSLVGFRYGKEHHALVAAFVTHVDDNAQPGACTKSFEGWAQPWVDSFDVDVKHEPPIAVIWKRQVVDVDSVVARTATMLEHETYAGTYAAYPVWQNACLIVGVAVPAREDEVRAREVRDRFAKEVLPRVEVLAREEPKERY